MSILLKNGTVYCSEGFVKKDVLIEEGHISELSETGIESDAEMIFDCSGMMIFPGFTDVHVHFREPGFEYKETIKTGTMAAAHGGYTSVCTMPNLKPAPVDAASIKIQTDIIDRDAVIGVYPYGAITSDQSGRGELSDMAGMKDNAIAFSDDGKGVQSEELMRKAMKEAKRLDRMITAHCEDESLLKGGCIHEGRYAQEHGYTGICSESEWKQAERDIRLAEESGCAYHICHVSTKETVELVRDAKKRGVNVSCETAPHYLVFCDENLQESGRFKMNPPIRSAEDRDALRKGITDGTVDMIATDHAPHSFEEKNKGLKDSMFGITGLETAFPVLYTKLVKQEKIITLEQLVKLLAVNPAKRFGAGEGTISEGASADVTVWNLEEEYDINSDTFLSKGKSTPFEGMHVFGSCILTIAKGKAAYSRK